MPEPVECRYPFTGAYERVFTHVLHGPGVRVERNPDLPPWPYPEGDGATVTLRPGDVLVTAEPIPWPHPELDGAPEAAVPLPGDEPPADTAGDAAGDTTNATPAPAPARPRQRSTTTTPDAGAAGAAV